jgi:uncharacterized secreted protein with C-terminal beta-propeller domain
MKMLKHGLTLTILAMSLAGCSGASDSSTSVTTELPDTASPVPLTQPPSVNRSKTFMGGFKKTGEGGVETFIKNGIYASNYNGADVAVLAEGITQNNAAADPGFSNTNVQESGVDEADRIEYDGNYLYLTAEPEWNDDVLTHSQIRVLKRNADFSLQEVASQDLGEAAANVNGMYLHNNDLSVLSGGSPIMTMAQVNTLIHEPRPSRVKLGIYDTTEPENISRSHDISIEGWLVSSRQINNQLYLVTSYSPFIDGLIPMASDDEQNIANYQTILDTPMDEIMPTVTIDGQTQPLNNPDNCLIPEDATGQDGLNQLVSITRINVEDPQDMSSICVSALTDIAYVSPQNLYLTANVEGKTAVHKISLTQDLAYKASGLIEGVLGWNGQSQLRLSENGEFLRVVTTDYSDSDPIHRLSVLSEQGGALSSVATLPNENQPEAIGKPGEDVYAVRFTSDKAYIVTFEKIDPLYVIDLSDNTQPQIVGSLEIPGFSSYLHPLSNNFLLGIGQEVNIAALPTNSDGGRLIPVEPDGGIGDGAGPIPIDPDKGVPIPVEPDGGIGDGAGPIPIDPDNGVPIPVEPDGGIGDGAGPIPIDPDNGDPIPVEPDGGIGDGAGPIPVEPDGGIGDGADLLPVVTTGMKISLFDVSDPSNPREVETIAKTSAYTPVEYNYKSLSVLSSNGQYQFALPMEAWLSQTDESSGIIFQSSPQNSLLLLDVSTLEGGSLKEVNALEVNTENKDSYFNPGNDRSVIHGEHVYFIHGNNVWHGQWNSEAKLQGPY